MFINCIIIMLANEIKHSSSKLHAVLQLYVHFISVQRRTIQFMYRQRHSQRDTIVRYEINLGAAIFINIFCNYCLLGNMLNVYDFHKKSTRNNTFICQKRLPEYMAHE